MDYPLTEIAKDTYLINEFDGTNCYLIVGDEKALLIDCGTGVSDLKGFCEKLCNKPIMLVATHGHCDHIGGAGQFSELYIHKEDTAFINRIQLTPFARKIFLLNMPDLKSHGFKLKDIKKGEYKTKIIPIEDGYRFELGGREITVHHTPGHSKGSIALIDEKEKLIFSGDNVCDALWMQLPGATSLEEWLPSAEWLYDMSENYRVFWGHRVPELKRDYIAKVIEWGKAIIESEKNSPLPIKRQFPKQEDGIIYNAHKVHEKR